MNKTTNVYVALQNTYGIEKRSAILNDQIKIDYDTAGNIVGVEIIKPWAYFVNDMPTQLIRNQNIVSQAELDQIAEIAKRFYNNVEWEEIEQGDMMDDILYRLKVTRPMDLKVEILVRLQMDFHTKVREEMPNLNCSVFVLDLNYEEEEHQQIKKEFDELSQDYHSQLKYLPTGLEENS